MIVKKSVKYVLVPATGSPVEVKSQKEGRTKGAELSCGWQLFKTTTTISIIDASEIRSHA